MAFTKILLIVSLLVVSNAAWQFGESAFSASDGFAPKVFWPFGNFPFGNNNFPPLPTPNMIAKRVPIPGQQSTGVMVSSVNGETTILTNYNGQVSTQHYGPDGKLVSSDPMKFKMPVMKKIDFPEFGKLHIDPKLFQPKWGADSIKDHVAGDGETYSGVSVSSHSYSSDINGKKTSGGGVSTLLNDGKSLEEKVVVFHNDD